MEMAVRMVDNTTDSVTSGTFTRRHVEQAAP